MENHRRASATIPFQIYCISLGLVGTVGNVIVVNIYMRKSNKTTTMYFILSLAIIDLAVSFLLVPFAVLHEAIFKYTFTDRTTCIIFEWLKHSSLSVSCITLSYIAIDRYLAICHPLSFILRPHRVKLMMTLNVVVGAGFQVQTFFLFGVKTTSLHGSLTGCRCDVKEIHYKKGFHGTFVFCILVMYICMYLVIAVAYIQVYLTVKRRKTGRLSIDLPVIKDSKANCQALLLCCRQRKVDNTADTNEVIEDAEQHVNATSKNQGATTGKASENEDKSQPKFGKKESNKKSSTPPIPGCSYYPNTLDSDIGREAKDNILAKPQMDKSGSPAEKDFPREITPTNAQVPNPSNSNERKQSVKIIRWDDAIDQRDEVVVINDESHDGKDVLRSHSLFPSHKNQSVAPFHSYPTRQTSCEFPNRLLTRGESTRTLDYRQHFYSHLYKDIEMRKGIPASQAGDEIIAEMIRDQESKTNCGATNKRVRTLFSCICHCRKTKKETLPVTASLTTTISSFQQARYNTARILLTVSVVFMLSWLPFWIIYLLDYFQDDLWSGLSDVELNLFLIVRHSYFINSMANPFIYAFLNKKFREDLKDNFRPFLHKIRRCMQ